MKFFVMKLFFSRGQKIVHCTRVRRNEGLRTVHYKCAITYTYNDLLRALSIWLWFFFKLVRCRSRIQ